MRTALTEARFNDPVTNHIHQDFTRLRLGQTIGQALDGLRRDPPCGRIIYFYVVDADDRLRGVVPTRRLLLHPLNKLIDEIMVTPVVTLPADATVLEAFEFFIQHRLLAFPVVDKAGAVLGVVDMKLYTDELGHLSEGIQRNDLFQLLGVHVTDAQHGSGLRAFRTRFPWLGCNLAAGILAAFLAGVYQHELNRLIALAFFIPVVLNLAESVSSQSVSLSLQALHGPPPAWRPMLAKLGRELATGFFLGLGAGTIMASVALMWLGQWVVALCLVGGISGGVAGAAVLGIALPYVMRLLRLEPRVAAGPIALAAADVWTILLYLNLARWLLA